MIWRELVRGQDTFKDDLNYGWKKRTKITHFNILVSGANGKG